MTGQSSARPNNVEQRDRKVLTKLSDVGTVCDCSLLNRKTMGKDVGGHRRVQHAPARRASEHELALGSELRQNAETRLLQLESTTLGERLGTLNECTVLRFECKHGHRTNVHLTQESDCNCERWERTLASASASNSRPDISSLASCRAASLSRTIADTS
jgi:hypothetical protein